MELYQFMSIFHQKVINKTIYTFVNQLSVIKNWREKRNQNEYSSNRKIFMSNEQSLAIERALQYKFPESIGNNQVLPVSSKTTRTRWSSFT
jgi:hypothetical protein